MIGSMSNHNVVARAYVSVHDDAQVRAKPSSRLKPLWEGVVANANPQLVAWQSRLRHLQLGGPDSPPLADKSGAKIESFKSKIFAEKRWTAFHSFAHVPVAIVLDRIRIHRLVSATMDFLLGLFVAL